MLCVSRSGTKDPTDSGQSSELLSEHFFDLFCLLLLLEVSIVTSASLYPVYVTIDDRKDAVKVKLYNRQIPQTYRTSHQICI